MNNDNFLLFVYGSLRSGFQHAAYEYLSKYFHLVGNAKVKGKLYDKGEYCVAVSTGDEHFIIGELYEINSPAAFAYAIGQLDDYEGIAAEDGEQPLFKREAVTVSCNDRAYTAWIYLYNQSIEGLPEIATGDVMLYLQQKNKL